MSTKRDIETLMRDFAKKGGRVSVVPPGKSTVDWSSGGFRNLASVVGKLGHKKRRKKKLKDEA
jgi:hypothetical protein